MQFREYWTQCKTTIDSTEVIQIFEWFGKQSLEEIFFYIFPSLKIDLTIPVVEFSSCELSASAERAFLKLTRIKNKYSCNRKQENLNVQIIFYSKNDLLN